MVTQPGLASEAAEDCPHELKRVWGGSELGLGSFQVLKGAGDEGVLRLDYNRRSKLSRNFKAHLNTWKEFGIIYFSWSGGGVGWSLTHGQGERVGGVSSAHLGLRQADITCPSPDGN